MKRKLSIFLMIAMLLSTVSLFSVSAEDENLTFTHKMTGISDAAGYSALQSNSTTRIEDSSLQYKTSSNASIIRRSTLLTFEDAVIPVGTYTVSVWARSTTNSSDWLNAYEQNKTSQPNSEIAMAFYSYGSTEESVSITDVSDSLALLKLTSFENSQYVADGSFKKTTNTMSATDSNGTTTRTWVQYEATVTLKQPCASVAFWMLGNGTNETTTWYAYFDNLSITQTAPTEHTDSITFRGVQNSAIDSTDAENPVFNTRLVSTLDCVDYTAAGYEVTVKAGDVEKSNTLYMTEAYESLTGHKDTTGESDTLVYKREYYNAGAIGAMTIQNLPAKGTVTLTVKPFTVGGNKTAPDVSYTVTYVDGVVTEIVTNSAD